MEGEAGLGALLESPKVHLLAVDDNLIERKVIERMLNTSAYKVTTVESGSRALEILGVGESHDYRMPGMSGFDLLKKIKEISALKEIPVAIMSSEIVPKRIQRCLAEGAVEFITKPLQLADVKRLGRHIRLSKPVDKADEQACCKKRKFSVGSG